MSERPNPGREDGRDQTRHSLPVHSHALHDASQDAVLDVQAIPHFVRHAAILGALSSLNPGFSLTIKASHLPAQLQRSGPVGLPVAQVDRLPGAFDYEVLQDGPEFWFVRITRTAL